MENNTVGRLLHTLFPFMLFVLIQRLLLLALGRMDFFTDPVLPSLIAFLTASAAAVLLFRLKTYAPTPQEENEPVSPPKKSQPLHGLLGIIAAVAGMIILMFLVNFTFGSPEQKNLTAGLLSFLSLIIIHPVLEEYIFRGLFYGELRQMNPIFGCLVQTVMFAIIHETVPGMIYALGSGLILAYMTENTGRLWVPMAAHSLINLRSWLCLTVLSGGSMAVAVIDRIFIVGGFACFILFLIIRNTPFLRSRNAAGDSGEAADE